MGDAYGWPLEFLKRDGILESFPQSGPDSIPGIGLITDDTQMTLFSVDALVRSRLHDMPLRHAAQQAYRRWHATQLRVASTDPPADQGWLMAIEPLYRRRAPGTTCMSALASGEPVLGSKGCGTVMRAAPAGLAGLEDPFTAGADLSIITHGHPTGVIAGAAMAWLCHALLHGGELNDSVRHLAGQLAATQEGTETALALQRVLRWHEQGGAIGHTHLDALGGGWTAESALAIAVLCALTHPDDFPAAMRLAAVHYGDSDSTAAMCGQLLGLHHGTAILPAKWLERVELREVLEQAADDLVALRAGDTIHDAAQRYPRSDSSHH